ncbi:MAG TPA: hypothetical protein VNF68_03910 [Candidatus Baltobacteraceae bacterium]|nr:hypothetical protein [Candidatus Baltobacteraceae bacterium]
MRQLSQKGHVYYNMGTTSAQDASIVASYAALGAMANAGLVEYSAIPFAAYGITFINCDTAAGDARGSAGDSGNSTYFFPAASAGVKEAEGERGISPRDFPAFSPTVTVDEKTKTKTVHDGALFHDAED